MVNRGDARAIGDAVAERLAVQAGAMWLHLDLDVFDVAAMPAITYRQAGGLDFAAVAALVAACAAREELIGVSIADLVPPRDPDGRYARAVVELVSDALREA
jgi:arginase